MGRVKGKYLNLSVKECKAMPFGAHETMEVHEVLNDKINMITHFKLYLQHCQNAVIRSMLEQHLNAGIQHYNQLVGYTHDYSAAGIIPETSRPEVQVEEIQYGLRHPGPAAPQLQGILQDNQIVSAMLSCHKHAAVNQMHAALECADPNVRQMLINGANTAAHHAYEVFLFMNQQGQYQVPTMQDHTAKTFLHTFQPVQTSMYPGPYTRQ
ncbi:spore coat protein [Paenibacillus larvae]|nr:spore coat protein [Paenibacillus larvae]PCK69908.1 hypothetical protein PL1_1859 [Paenibacillus larvae subsp. larvae B-3650]